MDMNSMTISEVLRATETMPLSKLLRETEANLRRYAAELLAQGKPSSSLQASDRADQCAAWLASLNRYGMPANDERIRRDCGEWLNWR